MCEAWYIYLGKQMNLSIDEIMNMRIGQFNDLCSCHAIYTGSAKPVKKKVGILDVLAMR